MPLQAPCYIQSDYFVMKIVAGTTTSFNQRQHKRYNSLTLRIIPEKKASDYLPFKATNQLEFVVNRLNCVGDYLNFWLLHAKQNLIEIILL